MEQTVGPVYTREGTISRMMAADMPDGEFRDFYSVSPEYFGYTLVYFQVVDGYLSSTVMIMMINCFH
jgi:hypothetical protein